MIVLVHCWHDLLHPSKLLFFSRSVNTDIGHSLQPLFCFLSRYFSSLPSLCRWCALLGMQEADHQAAENWGSFLFVCSPFHAAHPPFSAVAWPPPPTPGVMSTADAIRWGHANFVIENQSASQPSLYWQGHCLDRESFYYNAGREPNWAICVFTWRAWQGGSRLDSQGLDVFPVACYYDVCSHRQAH